MMAPTCGLVCNHPQECLFWLVCEGDFDGVQNYLNDGSKNCNELLARTDINGWTVVHHASYCGHYDVLKLLLRGSSSDIKKAASRGTHIGETPLMAACQAEFINVDVIHHLVSVGADPKARDNQGSTAMHFACESGFRGNLAAVKLLKDMGASVNAMNDFDYFIPLQCALRHSEDLELVRFLLPYSHIRKGKSDPLVLAIIYMEEAIPDVLKYMSVDGPDYVTCALQLHKIDIAVQLFRAGASAGYIFKNRRTADVVYSSLETFEALLGALDPGTFLPTFPVDVAVLSPQQAKEEFLRALLHKIVNTGLPFVRFPNLSNIITKSMSKHIKKCLSPENVALLYKYFPSYERLSSESGSVKSLKDLCRPVVRYLLITVNGDDLKALYWLESNNVLPSPIRKFLLYEQ